MINAQVQPHGAVPNGIYQKRLHKKTKKKYVLLK